MRRIIDPHETKLRNKKTMQNAMKRNVESSGGKKCALKYLTSGRVREKDLKKIASN